jgi:hypothetical protein
MLARHKILTTREFQLQLIFFITTNPEEPQTRDMKIYSTAFRGGVTSSVKLFDMTMSEQDIYDYLNAR